jgi:hypothetical protein
MSVEVYKLQDILNQNCSTITLDTQSFPILSGVKGFETLLNSLISSGNHSGPFAFQDFYTWFYSNYSSHRISTRKRLQGIPPLLFFGYSGKKMGKRNRLIQSKNYSLRYNNTILTDLESYYDQVLSSDTRDLEITQNNCSFFQALFHTLYLNIASYLLLHKHLELSSEHLFKFYSHLNPDYSTVFLGTYTFPFKKSDIWAFTSTDVFKPCNILVTSNHKVFVVYDKKISSSDWKNFLAQSGKHLLKEVTLRFPSTFPRARSLDVTLYPYSDPKAFINDVYLLDTNVDYNSIYLFLRSSFLPLDKGAYYHQQWKDYYYWTKILKNNPKTFYYQPKVP